jgi:hypothetical protein
MSWLDSDTLFADLLPAVQRAIDWIDGYGDIDSDGYVEYATHRDGGVQNQGWKDSRDAVNTRTEQTRASRSRSSKFKAMSIMPKRALLHFFDVEVLNSGQANLRRKRRH